MNKPLSKLKNTLIQTSSSTRSILHLVIITTLLLIWFNRHQHAGPQGEALRGHETKRNPDWERERRLTQIQSVEPTSAQKGISTRAAEEWLSRGTLSESLQASPASRPVDLLWTWANDSASLGEGPKRTDVKTDYLYRQHDELRFSLRSSLVSLPPDFVRSRQIMTADDPYPSAGSRTAGYSVSRQTRPDWLRSPLPTQDTPVLLRHHSHIFRFIDRRKVLQGLQWFKNYLPSHNSLAIESQFGHLEGIQDNLLYLNDDCFFINKFSQGDFASELFGPVFRIQFDLKVADDQVDRSGTEAARGEWPSLGYSNFLLSQRFGRRDRRYLSHLPKVLNIHVMREVSEIWREAIFLTASSRVRGQRRELNMMFLATWYQIEKHREAMLHSFIMLRSDTNQDGLISAKEWGEMMRQIGTRMESTDEILDEQEIINVYKPFRPRKGVVEDGLGSFAPVETDYEWLSSDGYPLLGMDAQAVPDYRHQEPSGSRTVVCQLNVTRCFPRPVDGGFSASVTLLRWVASERPECGDCLLALLIGQQSAGISSLLPPRTLRTKMAEWLDSERLATRPFVSFDELANRTSFFSSPFPRASRFSKRAFLTDDPRIWAIRNIQRYQYVIGNTPSRFDVLTTIVSSRRILAQLSSQFNKPKSIENSTDPSTSSSSTSTSSLLKEDKKDEKEQGHDVGDHTHRALLVTINDRIYGPHLPHVHALFKNWLHQSWPTPGPWEKV